MDLVNYSRNKGRENTYNHFSLIERIRRLEAAEKEKRDEIYNKHSEYFRAIRFSSFVNKEKMEEKKLNLEKLAKQKSYFESAVLFGRIYQEEKIKYEEHYGYIDFNELFKIVRDKYLEEIKK